MSNYNGCMACSPNPNIIALRAAYLSAEAELEKWKGEVRHSEARALAAERARDDLGNAFRVVRESCEAERAMGNGGCGCCTLCNKESRERAEVAEAALAKAREEVERAWACRDDEMALRTMEAEQRIAAERARDEALAEVGEVAAKLTAAELDVVDYNEIRRERDEAVAARQEIEEALWSVSNLAGSERSVFRGNAEERICEVPASALARARRALAASTGEGSK